MHQPEQSVKEVIYPIASPEKLTALIKAQESTGATYKEKVYIRICSSYLHHYRRMVPEILQTLEFQSNNDTHQPVIKALSLLKRSQGQNRPYFSDDMRALTPLLWKHVTPYGSFSLDFTERLALDYTHQILAA